MFQISILFLSDFFAIKTKKVVSKILQSIYLNDHKHDKIFEAIQKKWKKEKNSWCDEIFFPHNLILEPSSDHCHYIYEFETDNNICIYVGHPTKSSSILNNKINGILYIFFSF